METQMSFDFTAPVPKSLAGYQCLEQLDLLIEEGDLLWSRYGFEWAQGCIGHTVAFAKPEYRVYRKIPVANHKDIADPEVKALIAERETKAPTEEAATYDEGKAPLAELPWGAIDSLAAAQLYGHKKYGDFNNYRKGMKVTRNLSCALRHIRDYLNGHDKDHESGLHPLDHAIARVAFVIQNIKDGTAIDNRYKRPV